MNTIKLTLLTVLLLASLSALLPQRGAEAGLRSLAVLPERESILRESETTLPTETSFSEGYPFEVRTTDIVTTFP